MYMNKVVILGNLTHDPELRWLPSGVPVANFSVATNRRWNDRNGERQEEVEFHSVSVFGKQAQPCADYLKKGQQALVEGRLHTRSWEDDNGTKHYRKDIIAERVQFGPKRQADTMEASYGADANESDRGEGAALENSEDDIPF